MGGRATRSATRRARFAEAMTSHGVAAVATGPLGALSHDELGVIFDGLADPLHPAVAVALSSTCLGLRTPLRAALEVLTERHEWAAAACRRMKTDCAELSRITELTMTNQNLTPEFMEAFGMILRTNGLPRLESIEFANSGIGDHGIQALCNGLGHCAAPSLELLGLGGTVIGPPGATALAAALRRGAMRKLVTLGLMGNRVGKQGLGALAAPLGKMPALEELYLGHCDIGDDGVASLVANIGKDDFKALNKLHLSPNQITDEGMATLRSAVSSGAMPNLVELHLGHRGLEPETEASEVAVEAVYAALEARRRARNASKVCRRLMR